MVIIVKAKSVISMMMLSFGAMGLVAVLWVLYGFNMSFVDGSGADWIKEVVGDPFSDFGLADTAKAAFEGGGELTLAGVIFGATFAIITVALISGAIADRARDDEINGAFDHPPDHRPRDDRIVDDQHARGR